jgi:hypothetical protein
MVQIGYTMMSEQAGPRDLVAHVVRAEEAGFDFSVTSDHYFPWLDEQGHSPYAWSVLGAAAQANLAHPPDDLRDVPDDALPPGGRRAESSDDATAVRRPIQVGTGLW